MKRYAVNIVYGCPSVDMLKRGVVKIYEDLMPTPNPPTYAIPVKQGNNINSNQNKLEPNKKLENPYETVAVEEGTVVSIPKTVREIIEISKPDDRPEEEPIGQFPIS